MTIEELKAKIYNEFGIESWPPVYYVDAETYGNVCDSILKKLQEAENSPSNLNVFVSLGLNGGIMFKGIELILEKK